MTSLSKNVKLSIENSDLTGSFVVRSKTESFNLEHIVDKDVVSFYQELSSYAIIDTGIMPLSGTGVLAIRSAGNHTQITFQHAPQINYINWGTYEGDKNAKTYLVAQPYRIWIGDILDGNLYGARMFYSPYPITSSNQQLYHLNLPNTNCRGYRGNGVGWQCLYHKEDWSNLPLNEKIIRFAERCSGVETFNDNNMSETDGPRFYQAHDKPEYLWEPSAWQQKTSQDGLDWVLDESLWIPVLVEGIDNQDRHDESGVPLTLGMALIGNYQAYYSDVLKPKPINALTRSDLLGKVTASDVSSWIVRSHNNAKSVYVPRNTFEDSTKHRENIVANSSKSLFHDEEQEEEEEEEEQINFICPINGHPCSATEDTIFVDSLDNTYCQGCYEENTVYCENSSTTLPSNSEYLYYDSNSGEYYDVRDINYDTCPSCNTFQYVSTGESLSTKLFYKNNSDEVICCVDCIKDYLQNNSSDYLAQCAKCAKTIPINQEKEVHPDFENIYSVFSNVYLTVDENGNEQIVTQKDTLCSHCANTAFLCPTGHHTWLVLASLPVKITKNLTDPETGNIVKVTINEMCASCSNPDVWQHGWSADVIAKLSTLFSVVTKAEERFIYAFSNKLLNSCSAITVESEFEEKETEFEQKPF